VAAEPPRISVVIPTYQRLEACRRAIASALEQELPALEVLVCDDGSADGTQEALKSWAREEPRLHYLRLQRNHGAPAAARNLGTERARGEWIAFLDDDDRWLPEKLRIQGEAISTGRYDVVACDATRSGSGRPYFGLERAAEPDRAELLRHNPIITSTAIARRSALLDAGGFTDSAVGMSITGVEDYAAWLNLAFRGARFVVLPDPLVVYEDTGEDRVSTAAARQEAEVAAVRWRLWLRRPHDMALCRWCGAAFHRARSRRVLDPCRPRIACRAVLGRRSEPDRIRCHQRVRDGGAAHVQEFRCRLSQRR
jgi:glycosyltransferase involved in cell wall biosynthesis